MLLKNSVSIAMATAGAPYRFAIAKASNQPAPRMSLTNSKSVYVAAFVSSRLLGPSSMSMPVATGLCQRVTNQKRAASMNAKEVVAVWNMEK